MENSDDEEDISPNPDTAIQYGVDMAKDKGDINIKVRNSKIMISEKAFVATFTRDLFQETSVALKRVRNQSQY